MDNNKKKVLIITYYWPPSGGSGVQRWLKFSKYLPHHQWTPIIYTPENPSFSVVDEELCEDISPSVEVIKRKIWEPYHLYALFSKGDQSAPVNQGFMPSKDGGMGQRFGLWVRGNFFIPDARKFWIKPSITFLKNYLKEHPVDAIISTGPPHSMHLIAMGVKKVFPDVNWIADFRDPWTEIDTYHHLNLSKRADNKHHRLEKQVLASADQVVYVSQSGAKGLERIGGRSVKIIPNGYDETDFEGMDKERQDTQFTISHVGAINKDRHHSIFIDALSELVDEEDGFRSSLLLRLVGNVDASMIQALEEKNLIDRVKKIPYCSHTESILWMRRAQVLYLPINNVPGAKGILSGKFFEYMASRRPILCIAPQNGDVADLIKDRKLGLVADFEEKEVLKEHLRTYFKNFKDLGSLPDNKDADDSYSRRSLLKEYITLLEKKDGKEKNC